MADICGRGTDFRFVSIFEKNSYGQSMQRMVFLLHKQTVIVKEYEYRYAFEENGNLLIYQFENGMRDHFTGRVIVADHPVVKELKEAILEDSLEEMLIKE